MHAIQILFFIHRDQSNSTQCSLYTLHWWLIKKYLTKNDQEEEDKTISKVEIFDDQSFLVCSFVWFVQIRCYSSVLFDRARLTTSIRGTSLSVTGREAASRKFIHFICYGRISRAKKPKPEFVLFSSTRTIRCLI